MKTVFNWFKKYGGWVIIAVVLVIVAASINACKPSPERIQRAHAMTAELQTVTNGDLIQVGGDWEIVRSASKESVITVCLRNHQSVNHETEQMGWIVDRIVRQSDTTNYSAVCVELVKRSAR